MSKKQKAAHLSEIAKLRELSDARLATWRKVMSAGLNEKPELGEPCPYTQDSLPEYYPVEYFDIDQWMYVGIREWDQSEVPLHYRKAILSVEAAEDSLKRGYFNSYEQERLMHFQSPAYWGFDLTLLELDEIIPEQGHTGSFAAGSKVVRALLYSYAEEKIVCEAVYAVSNGESIEMSFDVYGTQEEIAQQQKTIRESKPNAEVLSAAVMLDLSKMAYYSANSKLMSVVSRSPLAEEAVDENPEAAEAEKGEAPGR